jgi:hypothetical protein
VTVTVAALFCDPKGVYAGIEGVEVWGEDRDARLYQGPHPVVSHPPCSRWCRLAGLVEARYGHKRGEDGGCFASALASVRKWGGVLEHPAYSDAWAAFELPTPNPGGGWQRGICGGWSCHVEQSRYGHVAKKATWLYAYGTELPALRWGSVPDSQSLAWVSWCGNHTGRNPRRAGAQVSDLGRGRENRLPRVGKKAASATPIEFRDVLIAMARSVHA